MLKVLSDLLEALDRGDVGVQILLDLSAAFDTVDHETLLWRLELTVDVSGNALGWLASISLDVSTSFELKRTVPKYSSCLLVCHRGPFQDHYFSSCIPWIWFNLFALKIHSLTFMSMISSYTAVVGLETDRLSHSLR